MAADLPILFNGVRLVTTQANAPGQARQTDGVPKASFSYSTVWGLSRGKEKLEEAAVKVSTTSPGFVYDPYEPCEPIPLWKRFYKKSWEKNKRRYYVRDNLLRLYSQFWLYLRMLVKTVLPFFKSAYATAKLRKKGFSKQQIYAEALDLYKELTMGKSGCLMNWSALGSSFLCSSVLNLVGDFTTRYACFIMTRGWRWKCRHPQGWVHMEINSYMANGDKTSLRKPVTEKMYSVCFLCSSALFLQHIVLYLHYDLTLLHVIRYIAVDKEDLEKKFEADDSSGAIVAGDKNKEGEKQLPSLTICQRLFNLIINNPIALAFKPVTLGRTEQTEGLKALASPSPGNGLEKENKEVQPVQDKTVGVRTCLAHFLEETDSDVAIERAEDRGIDGEMRVDGTEERGPPKKSVSIKDSPEEIPMTKKKQYRKSGNLVKDVGTVKELRPSKSILKVSSDLKENLEAQKVGS
ncbi:hypothetical protein RJ641_023599 [Dillenia turbinata]|uniref:Uncharacterized protein n=1 Tax=Dillenia turbinata TaxID=194707 RepID=A0AAN8YSQ3_9MAGN